MSISGNRPKLPSAWIMSIGQDMTMSPVPAFSSRESNLVLELFWRDEGTAFNQ